MAAATQGTAHFFGVNDDMLTNATITSISASEEFGLNEETADGDGNVIETRRDNRIKNATVVMRLQSGYTFPDIGDLVTLAGMQDTSFNGAFEVVNKGQEYQSGTHLEQTLELVKHAEITYA